MDDQVPNMADDMDHEIDNFLLDPAKKAASYRDWLGWMPSTLPTVVKKAMMPRAWTIYS